jgi:hypothetical protein
MKRKFIAGSLVIYLISILTACPPPTEGPIADVISDIQSGFARIVATLQEPVGMTLASLANASIAVVGQPAKRLGDSLNAATGKVTLDVDTKVPGAFDPLNVNPDFDRSAYQLIIYDNTSSVGIKLDGLKLQSGVETTLSSSLQLRPTGSISGVIALSDARSSIGTTIGIPGTSFSASADSVGHFTITGVPAGKYEMLRASLDGYYASTISNVIVTSAAATDIGTVTLILSTGASGNIMINHGAPFSSSLQVTVSVGASGDAVLMRISESEAFTGASWQPLQYTSSYQFATVGVKRLYLSLADANGLATSIGYADITISTDPTGTFPQSPTGTISNLRPQFTWSVLADAAAIPDEVYDLQVSSDQSFGATPLIEQLGLTAITYTPTQDYLLADSTYYWRVRSRIPSESLVGNWYSASFQLGAAPFSLSPSTSQATLQPMLTWSQPFTGATYDLQITTASDTTYALASSYPGGTAISGESYNMETVSKALNDGSYRFRVRSKSAGGYVSNWVEQTFSISALPSSLSSSGPTNDNTPSLIWAKAYAAGSTEVQVDNSSDFATNEAATVATGTSYTTPILADGLYHWRARTTVTVGSTTFTSQWVNGSDFTVNTVPTALSSPGSTNNNTPTLSWTAGYTSASTEVQVASDTAFANIAASATVTGVSYTTPILADGLYHWRARTTVTSGSNTYKSQWVNGSDFTVDTRPSSLSSPVLSNTNTPTLTWAAGYASASTEIQVDNSADFASNEAGTGTTGTTGTSYTTPILADGLYHWRARTTVTSGSNTYKSQWVNGSDFTVDTTGPTGSVTINGGAATTYSEKLSLTLSATDPSGVTQMYISPDGSFTDAAWITYSTSYALNLTSLAGTNDSAIVVHVKLKDTAGNISSEISNSITLHRTLVGSTVMTSNTTWSASGGPYIITGNVTVNSGYTLMIQAGTAVYYNGDFQILIKGSVAITGSSASPVVFDAFGGVTITRMLMFKSTNLSLSTISYATMKNSTMAVQLADESEFLQDSPKNSGTLTIDHLSLDASGLLTAGYQTGAKLNVTNSTISNSTIKGRYPRTEAIKLDTCVVTNSNIISDSYNDGVTVTKSTLNNCRLYIGCCSANMSIDQSNLTGCSFSEGGGSPVNGPLLITKSTFTNTGILLRALNASISDSTFSFDAGYTQTTGLKIGNGSIIYSRVTGNGSVTAIDITGYNGYDPSGSFTLDHMDVTGASRGLQFDSGTTTGTLTVSNSNFYNNGTYNLANLMNKDVTATGNYWGSSNDATIQAMILDGMDNGNYGIVNYSTFQTVMVSGTGPRP